LILADVFTVIDSPVGELFLIAESGALTGLYFAKPARSLTRNDSAAPFPEARNQLEEYFAGKRKGFDLPLAPAGNEFQLKVWKALEEIPYGETRSYGEVAGQLGLDPESARAVGAANGQNPICIVVPCHRVVGADGKLVGYSGGLERKQKLLDLESPRQSLF
jgi:methylated-DNA-[protein]-cysteine S-methyltransferase